MITGKIKLSVVGCGGNGSQVLSGLPRLHIALTALGHPGLEVEAYDPDVITEANVGRQLFSAADIGQFKSSVLINRLNLYYGLDWRAYAGCYGDTSNRHIAYDNIVIGCVDTIAARKTIASVSRARYWLDLGNSDKKGQVILGELQDSNKDPNRLPHFFDLNPELKRKNAKEDSAPSCSLAEALQRQDLFINQTVATFALQLLWQFIRQGGLDIHGYYINLETGRTTPIPITLK
jgi:PRTRC genetic system ThiF family protein